MKEIFKIISNIIENKHEENQEKYYKMHLFLRY